MLLMNGWMNEYNESMTSNRISVDLHTIEINEYDLVICIFGSLVDRWWYAVDVKLFLVFLSLNAMRFQFDDQRAIHELSSNEMNAKIKRLKRKTINKN